MHVLGEQKRNACGTMVRTGGICNDVQDVRMSRCTGMCESDVDALKF